MPSTNRRGPWVPEEDQLLLQLVREQGPNNWVRISQHMHYRSPKQCRERFHQNLKPSLNRDPISAEEGLMIERMVDEMGKRWAEIARRLGNRSDNAVKNWWNGSMNRKRRGLSTVSAAPASRTYNGRIEPPYHRASATSPRLSRTARIPSFSYDWAGSPGSETRGRRESCSTASASASVAPSAIDPPSTLHPKLTPIYTLPSINCAIETPLTSPAFSDSSTVDPPSMVSDHNSVSSSSPRTIPSPQLLCLPVDIRRHSFDWRDGRAPLDHHIPDFGVKSAWNRHSAALHGWIDETRDSSEAQKNEPARDARMGLDNLLN